MEETHLLGIHIGTFTDRSSKGIYHLTLDRRTGQLSAPALVAEVINPGFLAWHPALPVLFAVSETDTVGPEGQGAVLAFAAADDGSLTKLSEQASGGAGACYVSIHEAGTHAFVSNYHAGSVAAFPIQPDGRVGPPSSVVAHQGSSVHPTRQRKPYAHSIVPAPGTPFVLAADLGIDRVLVYRFDEASGTLSPLESNAATMPPGSGPRHLAFMAMGEPGAGTMNRSAGRTANGTAASTANSTVDSTANGSDTVLVINELASTIAVCSWDAARGALTCSDPVIPTLPADFSGENTTAEIAVHPNGRFVYGSNRGHDSIAIFHVEPDRRLTRIGFQSTQGKVPRHFAIEPRGELLVAANQDSDSLVVFRIDLETGLLSETNGRATVPSPVCVRFR